MNCHLFAATSIELHFMKAWRKFSAYCGHFKPRNASKFRTIARYHAPLRAGL